MPAANTLIYNTKEFKEREEEALLSDLKDYLLRNKLSEINDGQVEAWKQSIYLLKGVLCNSENLNNACLLFEYLIPLGGNRRPDTIILHGETIYLIEFKNKATFSNEDVDQLKAYYNDLKLYHSYAANYDIKPILVLLRSTNRFQLQIHDMHVVSSDVFYSRMCATLAMELRLDVDSFINASFKPILPIEEYARQIFDKTTFDNIEAIQIENIEHVYNEIVTISKEAKKKKHHALILISGEPGSGKSALGLRLVHDLNGLYCSKNKKFIEYLHTILGHKVNITDNYSFIREYALGDKEPDVNFFVFDEAQRMWDGNKPKQYWNIDDSEQLIAINTCFSKEWGVLVALIGLGQQLGYDEREHFNSWLVDDPRGLKYYASPQLRLREKYIQNDDRLHLSGSLRAFQTGIVNRFIDKLITGWGIEFVSALKPMVVEVIKSGYAIYVSRHLQDIESYLMARYKDSPNSHCYIATSQVEMVSNSPFSNDFQDSRKLNIKEYFQSNGKILNSKEKNICISPYDIQGLELKMPVICWEEDFLWYNDNWKFPFITSVEGGIWQIINAYRVMLTRGRDGIIIYLPNEWDFNSTYCMFRDIGIPEL